MDSKPIVYVSRITNLSDARYCAGMGVDLLGFVVNPGSPDYVSPEAYQALMGWVSGPRRVAEIISSTTINVQEMVDRYSPELLHVTPDMLDQLPGGLPLILEASTSELTAVKSLVSKDKHRIEFLMITDAVDQPIPCPPTTKVLVSLHAPIDAIATYLGKVNAHGIALRGSPELTPGLKDYDHLSTILEQLED
ncbi:MAG: hypothetical protein SH819_00280 [Cytophagales bacterium]|nr:hypothetical protein [Cytophagales bacterium]